jgi:polysaccharide export outer membrane protein
MRQVNIVVFILVACCQSVCQMSERGYLLGPGDQFVINTLHVQELAGKTFRVESEGFVNFPMAGRLKVSGLSVDRLSSELTNRLKEFYLNPEISVTMTEFRSQQVSVVGSVNASGLQVLQGPKTLVEVLSQAGGLRADAGPMVRVTREIKWGRLPVAGAHDDPSGEYSIAELDAQSVLSAANPAQNFLVRPNDVISVPKADIVYVLGEVKKPGGFVLSAREELSVLEALSMAEGFQARASAKGCKILRASGAPGSPRREEAVDVRKILDGKAADVKLRPDDILVVPNSASKSATLRGLETAIQVGTGLVIFHR